MSTVAFLDDLWTEYVASTPQAGRIHELLTTRGEQIHHDHVAMWTYAAPGIGIESLERAFEDHGWRARGRDRFDDGQLRGRSLQHHDPEIPMILILELDLAKLSPRAQEIIAGLVAQLPARFARRGLTKTGRPWHVAHADYQELRAESEHAAWVAAFGPRAHHFTIDVSALATFPDLVALDAFLIEYGFPVDGPDPLDHSSTRADSIEVVFDDATVPIPAGTYELVLGTRRGRERREVVVELEQHIDIDADELHAHTARSRPAHHGG